MRGWCSSSGRRTWISWIPTTTLPTRRAIRLPLLDEIICIDHALLKLATYLLHLQYITSKLAGFTDQEYVFFLIGR